MIERPPKKRFRSISVRGLLKLVRGNWRGLLNTPLSAIAIFSTKVLAAVRKCKIRTYVSMSSSQYSTAHESLDNLVVSLHVFYLLILGGSSKASRLATRGTVKSQVGVIFHLLADYGWRWMGSPADPPTRVLLGTSRTFQISSDKNRSFGSRRLANH